MGQADAFERLVSAAASRRRRGRGSRSRRSPACTRRTPGRPAVAPGSARRTGPRNDPTGDRHELIERLDTVNARAIDLTETLLLLSRADGKGFARGPVDLSLLAEEAAETLLPLAEQAGITLDVTGEAAETIGSEVLMARMVTNLVQNAIVHNHRTNGVVTVHTETQRDACLLRVENTGQPVPPDLVPALTEPFRRGTERVRADDHAGVGLGLAIVHSIVGAHDGTLHLTPRDAGGLRVTARFHRPPLAATTPLGDRPARIGSRPAPGSS